MKPIEEVQTVCSDCAEKLGFTPKDKVVGVWMDNCDNCMQYRPCTNLWHDWERNRKHEST